MSSYEFNAEEEKVIQAVKGCLNKLGIAFTALSAAHAITLLLAGPDGFKEKLMPSLMGVKNVVVFGFVGFSLLNSSKAFSKVVKEKGNDVGHLMKGLTSMNAGLSKIFMPILIASISTAVAAIKGFAEEH
eukprot:comp10196_c0_seq1/m.5025 comp10196_c0_seq1/g.5025  ORF comp10196_c0_seq1/g.5025 comp10196_c0_seq1/m.5025 type:complete len:130 (-) comp10196_c0_seq1:235-624(-)